MASCKSHLYQPGFLACLLYIRGLLSCADCCRCWSKFYFKIWSDHCTFIHSNSYPPPSLLSLSLTFCFFLLWHSPYQSQYKYDLLNIFFSFRDFKIIKFVLTCWRNVNQYRVCKGQGKGYPFLIIVQQPLISSVMHILKIF